MQRADFKVVLDACVLANAGVCDLLLRLAEPPRLFLPLWSGQILDEVRRTQIEKLARPYPPDLADYWRQEVTRAFPEAVVSEHERLIAALTNDEKDRHVLAAAIRGGAESIVTFNLRHFPTEALRPWHIQASHPEDFLLTLHSIHAGIVVGKLAEIAHRHESTLQDVLIHLGKSVPAFSRRVLENLGETR